jgi:hypothetical protein
VAILEVRRRPMAEIKTIEIALGYAQQGYCPECKRDTRHERAVLSYDDGTRERMWQCQACRNIHEGKRPDGA